jgi:hypothetical protein
MIFDDWETYTLMVVWLGIIFLVAYDCFRY